MNRPTLRGGANHARSSAVQQALRTRTESDSKTLGSSCSPVSLSHTYMVLRTRLVLLSVWIDPETTDTSALASAVHSAPSKLARSIPLSVTAVKPGGAPTFVRFTVNGSPLASRYSRKLASSSSRARRKTSSDIRARLAKMNRSSGK